MQVYVDADGCPVVDITLRLCKQFHIPCALICDTAHQFFREDAKIITVDQGPDSVDLAIANRVRAGDVVITQDYGLASMCLAKNARVLHQDGWLYTADNIDALLFQRHQARKLRAAGGRLRGSSKRTAAQDKSFLMALQQLLQG